jgi:hypothetical protein
MLIVALLALASWGIWKCRSEPADDTLMDSYDQVLIGLLILAALALGVSSTFFLTLVF